MDYSIRKLAAVFRPERVQFGKLCLDVIIPKKLRFDQLPAGSRERKRLAAEILSTVLDGVGGFLGNDVLAEAYGPDLPAAGRDDQLSILWGRLWFAEKLFSTVEGTSQASISALREEILAVANGDQPVLLARMGGAGKQGLGRARFKVLLAKLEILQWKAFLKGPRSLVRVPMKDFNSWIKIGFDASAANDWKSQVVEGLGAENVDLAMRLARNFWMRLPTFYTARDVEVAVRQSAAAMLEAEKADSGE